MMIKNNNIKMITLSIFQANILGITHIHNWETITTVLLQGIMVNGNSGLINQGHPFP